MTKTQKLFSLVILFFMISACSLSSVSTNDSNGNQNPDDTDPTETATETDMPATETESPSPIPPDANTPSYPVPDPEHVAYDFAAHMCEAGWSNNMSYFPCPGDPNGIESVSLVDLATLADGTEVELPTILMVASQNNGVFGHYPGFTVYPGDELRALLACPSMPCTVEFAVEYFDGNRDYQGVPNSIFTTPIPADFSGYYELVVPLDALAGQTVDILLVIREQEGNNGMGAYWIAPHIYRDLNATPLAVPSITPRPTNWVTNTPSGPTETPEDTTPGSIAGYINYGGVPSNVNTSQAAVVMFFNLDDYTWWWVHTTATHPYFSWPVAPGRWVVVGFVRTTSGGEVAVGYTGGGATCGSGLAVVQVDPNEDVTGLVLTDWCGSGSWPTRPGSAVLP